MAGDELLDRRHLLGGEHLGLEVGDPGLLRDGLGRGLIVAGEHHDVENAGPAQSLHRLPGLRPDGIGNRDQAADVILGAHDDGGPAAL